MYVPVLTITPLGRPVLSQVVSLVDVGDGELVNIEYTLEHQV